MKNKILALFASLSMSGFVFGDIQIGENVTIKGFIDASYQNTNSDAGSDNTDVSLDEVEIDFLFNSGPVSARIDLDTNPDARSADDGHGIEQAHFTYTTDGGLSVTVGRMGTMLGFEREDPAGLYTYSRAYGHSSNLDRFNLGNIDGQNASNSNRNDGVRFGYATDAFAINLSVDQDSDQNLDVADSRLNYELHVGYTGVENLNVGVGYRNDRSGASAQDVDIINVNAAYTAGKALIAGEYTTWNPEAATKETLDAFMILLDYDFSDKFGGAVRYSTEDYETLGVKTEQTKWTIAPNYQITDNLGTIVEFSSINPDGGNNDSTQFAVELTYTF